MNGLPVMLAIELVRSVDEMNDHLDMMPEFPHRFPTDDARMAS